MSGANLAERLALQDAARMRETVRQLRALLNEAGTALYAAASTLEQYGAMGAERHYETADRIASALTEEG